MRSVGMCLAMVGFCWGVALTPVACGGNASGEDVESQDAATEVGADASADATPKHDAGPDTSPDVGGDPDRKSVV